jgi:RES domain-containing protein
MLSGTELARALGTVPLLSIVGPWHRAISHDFLTKPPPGFPASSPPQPLWPGGARAFGGRFTPKGSFDTLYLCSDQETALLETNAAFKPTGGPIISVRRNPLTLTQIEGSLAAVLDLTDDRIQKTLDVDQQLLTGQWRTVANPPTQVLGAAAEASGRIVALKSYSAKNAGVGTIVAVFTAQLSKFPPSFVEVVDSSGRLAQRLP